MNILLIMAHPRTDSFSDALAKSYHEGAGEASQNVKRLDLCVMEFERDVLHASPKIQQTEDCITEAQKMIAWANHLVFVYPTWWGTFPALLKAFFDRVFTEGFAFEEIDGGTGYRKLLNNKSAQIITTMDTPSFIYRHFLKAPGNRAIGGATLKFCGISPVVFHSFGPIRGSTALKREKWLMQSKIAAIKFADKRNIERINFYRKFSSWLKAVRFQFYPLSILAFLLGSLLVSYFGGDFNATTFVLGVGWVFALELTSVLINEKEDLETDKQNQFFGMFSGGSRIIVDGLLSVQQINKGILISLFSSIILGAAVLISSPASKVVSVLVILISTALAIGYTAPPLKLSYRGFAALDVAFTHSMGVIVAGFVFQGGNWDNPIVWLISIPLFLSIMPAIVLAGIPDRIADRAVNKKTIAARLGKRNAAKIALLFTLLTILSIFLFYFHAEIFKLYFYFILLSFAHAAYLIYRLSSYIKNSDSPNRIDGLIALSLGFILWFVIIPIINLILL